MILNNIQKILAILVIFDVYADDTVTFEPYNRKLLHEKIFCYSVLENFRGLCFKNM